MNDLHRYTIAFKGVSDGSHHYDFEIGDSFFQKFEGSDIKGGELEVNVDFTKRGSLMMLDFAITGSVEVECDRCLEDFSLPVDYNGRLTVRVGEGEADNDQDVVWLSPGDDMIPLAQYIYESVYLSLPYQKVHPDDDSGQSMCDPQMLAKFKVVTQEEFDEIAARAQEDKETNPQWQRQLQELKNKMEQE